MNNCFIQKTSKNGEMWSLQFTTNQAVDFFNWLTTQTKTIPKPLNIRNWNHYMSGISAWKWAHMVSGHTDSPVSQPPPVSLTNSRRLVRSVTDADKSARRLKPWCKPMLFLSCCNTTCRRKLSASVIWMQTPAGFRLKGCGEEDDKQLAHICLSLSLNASLCSCLCFWLTSCICPRICKLPHLSV